MAKKGDLLMLGCEWFGSGVEFDILIFVKISEALDLLKRDLCISCPLKKIDAIGASLKN